ncbi:hypothetical protein EH244_31065 [Variovorax beijingensis]|uniref:Uncharacterized protein n=1 Tax=Variovorax beijingensis TaxID=2496117 RepID=A0A3P3E151_9BURK|nr:hypothetical protein [Variovorax beijingensis]RRH80119.1 hypothetical protein EH244_31065 [Variovorax beijingensis]
MASVVDTSVKHFNSTMSGAPALSGTAGSLIALLDAVLVNGFDLKNATSLTVAGGVATLAFTGSHSAQVDSVITLSGSSVAALNGEQKVTAIAPGAVKFATAAADGAASGAVTFKMAPLGFAKPFAAANVGAYKSTDIAASGFVLRVDDTTTTSARVVGYESMSDINTGVGAFPTAAQMPGGGYWAKSLSANMAAVAWAIQGDSRLFYITIQAGSSSGPVYQAAPTRCFGDPIAFKPGGDPYACLLNFSNTSTVNSMTLGSVASGADAVVSACPRDYTGLGSGTLAAIYAFCGAGVSAVSGQTNLKGAFPSAVDGGLWLSEKYLALAGSPTPRARMPGFYHCPQTGVWSTFKMNDRTPGSSLVAGRNLMAVTTTGTVFSVTSDATNTGIAFIDVTGPWR